MALQYYEKDRAGHWWQVSGSNRVSVAKPPAGVYWEHNVADDKWYNVGIFGRIPVVGRPCEGCGGGGIGGFIDNAVNAAGHAVGAAVDAVSSVTGIIGKGIAAIPVVGDPLSHVYAFATEPLTFADDIAHGKNIDQAALDSLKRDLTHVKAVAPYAQTVISFVPGIGPEVSGAIAVGLALANGQTIDEALIEGVRGALPGGPLAKAAFDATHAVISGKRVDQVAFAALPINDRAKGLIQRGVDAAQKIASGERLDKVALKNADALIDQGLNEAGLSASEKDVMRIAIKSGIAVAQGQKLQEIAARNLTDPYVQSLLVQEGRDIASSDSTVQHARDVLKDGQHGFDLATGLLQRSGVGISDFTKVRNSLSPADKKGFDIATSLHIGKVTNKKLAISIDGKARAGYLITKGMMGAPADNKAAIMKLLASHPAVRTGALAAVKEVAAARESFWHKVARWLHLVK
jgi:hypothetical protein